MSTVTDIFDIRYVIMNAWSFGADVEVTANRVLAALLQKAVGLHYTIRCLQSCCMFQIFCRNISSDSSKNYCT